MFRFAAAAFDLGMATVEAAQGDPVRITGPARTVVDLMRWRRTLGEPLAYVALRRYLAAPGGRTAALVDLAKALDVLGPVRAAIDVLEAS